MAGRLVLVAAAWAAATAGGTAGRDLAVVVAVLCGAAVSAGVRGPPRHPAVAPVVLLLIWLVLDGPVRDGWSTATLRVPLLVVVALLTVAAVRRLTPEDRDEVLTGLVLLGCLQATWACAETLLGYADAPSGVPRADGTLGSANALGMVLVGLATLAAYRACSTGGRGWWAAVVIQALGVLATGSRSGAFLGVLVLVVAGVRGRRTLLLAAAAAGGAVGAVVAAVRLSREPQEQRAHLWREALDRVAAAPWAGEGPLVGPFTTSAPSARVTTHAHNEVIQWTVEYGLVGLALAALTAGAVVVVVVRGVRRGTLEVATGPAVAAGLIAMVGLVDVGLRVTAVVVVLAALCPVTMSSRPRWLADPPTMARRQRG